MTSNHPGYRASRGAASVSILIGAVVLVTGCAARSGNSFASRFVKRGEPAAKYEAPVAVVPQESLSDYARRLRELQAMRRTRTTLLPTIESSDPALASALLALSFEESAENHRRVAVAYRNAGVLDYAYRHFRRALKLDECDSAAHEGVARLWREWRRPDLALGDVYRAIHCRPHSSSAYNTLGTVLLTLGQRQNARQAFEFALRLDGTAAYALNNLCYLSLLESNGVAAQRACERALALDPGLKSAQTNLALALAVQGDIASAEKRLLTDGGVAKGQYNVGILRMALGRFEDAAEAFESAARARPALAEAARRAVQARAFAAAAGERDQ